MNRKITGLLLLVCGGLLLHVGLVSWTKEDTSDTDAIKSSVVKSFAILQQSGATFIAKARCAACHHSTLTSMIAEKLPAKGITGVDTTAGLRIMAMNNTIKYACNPNFVNRFVPAKFLSPYVLLGLSAEKFPPNLSTDISVDYLMTQELPDGSFKAEYARVPFECGDIHLTALCIRAIQLYGPPARSAQVKGLVMRTKEWLQKQHTTNQQELSFQLLGMQWCGSDMAAKKGIAEKLLALQREDGGWSQLPTMASDAYATGEAMYALAESGVIPTGSEAYQNGIRYLLRTQDTTGAWIVVTRANPIQPFIDSEFPPYDYSQYISAAATNWATLALIHALPDEQ